MSQIYLEKTILGISLLVLFMNTARAENPNFEAVSRCFFVYAPIFESGEKLQNPELFNFGQRRIRWLNDNIQNYLTNPEFKRVFEGGLVVNKENGLKFQKSLMNSIASKNKLQFTTIMNEAVNCDRQLGIKTELIPKI